MTRFLVVLFVLICLGTIIFSVGQNELRRKCNGVVIGREQSGQLRNIYKCCDGTTQIF